MKDMVMWEHDLWSFWGSCQTERTLSSPFAGQSSHGSWLSRSSPRRQGRPEVSFQVAYCLCLHLAPVKPAQTGPLLSCTSRALAALVNDMQGTCQKQPTPFTHPLRRTHASTQTLGYKRTWHVKARQADEKEGDLSLWLVKANFPTSCIAHFELCANDRCSWFQSRFSFFLKTPSSVRLQCSPRPCHPHH